MQQPEQEMGVTDAPADFDAAMRALGVGSEGEGWREGWADSRASFPAGGPAFLRAGFVRDVCDELAVSADLREAIVRSLAMFEDRPALRALAWHCHVRLFGSADARTADLRQATVPWPTDPRKLPDWGGMFYPAVLISGGPFMQALHRRRGVPQDVTRDTASDLELWMRHYRRATGRWGLAQARWLASHFLGRLFKLGRLQFRFERFAYDFRAFRRRSDGRVVLLAPGGARFRRDGQFDGATGVRDSDGAWTSAFSAGDEVIRGNAISPDGRALPETIELPAEKWEPILRPGDAILGVHIPAGEPMTHEACGESFRLAAAFFARHFGEYAFRAFNCTSWFLDNQFGRLLPEGSNIRRFQEEVYLYPLPDAEDSQMFERVFGDRPETIESAPRDTMMRRLIVEHILAGGHFHAGGMLLFARDLDWGRRVYRFKE